MAELSPQAQALLESQKRRYLASLKDKGGELASLWSHAGENGLDGFLDAVHRLAGSAGLHGLNEIQQSAARVEQCLKAHRTEASDYETEVRELIHRLTNQGS